jgi:ketosteroid isomerase-like protein
MSSDIDTIERYLDGFRESDHEQILSCLTDDIEWTLFGGYHLSGKAAYDAEIENPAFSGRPDLRIVRHLLRWTRRACR